MVQKKAKKKGKKQAPKKPEAKPEIGLKIAAVRIQEEFEEAQNRFLARDCKLAVTMDTIISRFPVLAARILNSLDDNNFVNCMIVSRSWSSFTKDGELLLFKRMRIALKKLICGYKDFKEAWKSVMKQPCDYTHCPQFNPNECHFHDEANDEEMIKKLAITYFLLKHPANQDCKHKAVPYSPLHIAAESSQASVCEFIMKITKYKSPSVMDQKKAKKRAKKKGNKAEVVSDKGWTQFYEAAVKGHLEIYQMIMWSLEISNFTDFHPRDDKGSTPLHLAAAQGQLETCRWMIYSLILNNVIDINPSDHEGTTPLHLAVKNSHIEVWKFIAMIVDKTNAEEGINPKNNAGETPLHIAACQGYLEICRLTTFSLVINKKHLYPKDYWGCTPLHLAAANDQKEVWKFIVDTMEDKNPEEDINPKAYGGGTPFHLAASRGHLEMCKMMIDKGININPMNDTNWTPLRVAAENGHKEVCKFIADKFEDKNEIDWNILEFINKP